jgi:hypothetical protein
METVYHDIAQQSSSVRNCRVWTLCVSLGSRERGLRYIFLSEIISSGSSVATDCLKSQPRNEEAIRAKFFPLDHVTLNDYTLDTLPPRAAG